MSRHEGVSCDSCLKGNFRGRRYKCLICYDYDLCASCYESGATTTRHTTEHPMQCILTRSDFETYYGGEALSLEQPQSFTCPFCSKMGFTESSLYDHVSAEHNASYEVVCPICAALPVGEPNHVTDDFLGHLTLEHRNTRELEEPGGSTSNTSNSRPVRRIPHPGRGGMNHNTRRRHAAHMQFASSSTGFTSLSPRESMDPIAELLSQLSGVRRSTSSSVSNTQTTSAQLQQLQMQLQIERQQAQMARQQLERLPAARRQQHLQTAAAAAASNSMQPIFAPNSSAAAAAAVLGRSLLPTSHQQLDLRPNLSSVNTSQFLLSRCTESNMSENEQHAFEIEQADHSMFVQELLLMSLSDDSTSTGSSTDTEGAIVSLLPVEDDKSCDQSENPIDRFSNTSKKCDASATASKTLSSSSSSNNELLTNSSLVHSRKHANNSQSTKIASIKQPQPPVVVVRDSPPMQSPMNRVGIPARISGSGTQNIGGGSSYNLRNQQGNGGNGGTGQGIVRGGTPAGSTSSGRARKVQRHIDDRNKSNEPPPH